MVSQLEANHSHLSEVATKTSNLCIEWLFPLREYQRRHIIKEDTMANLSSTLITNKNWVGITAEKKRESQEQ